MTGRIFDFPAVDRGGRVADLHVDQAALDRRDAREAADADHAEAVEYGLLIIVGAAGFIAGCLFTAAAALVWSLFL